MMISRSGAVPRYRIGQHVVSVLPAPNEQNQAPSSVTVMVVEGQTYNFTAVVRGGLITLIKGT